MPCDNQRLDILFSLVVSQAAHKVLTVGAPSCHHSLLCCVMFRSTQPADCPPGGRSAACQPAAQAEATGAGEESRGGVL